MSKAQGFDYETLCFLIRLSVKYVEKVTAFILVCTLYNYLVFVNIFCVIACDIYVIILHTINNGLALLNIIRRWIMWIIGIKAS